MKSSAGVPPAVQGASRPRFGEVQIHDRGHLPHWEAESGTYFVTFRLADSLPKAVLKRIAFERNDVIQTALHLGRKLTADEIKRLRTLSSVRIERYLDAGHGACQLRDTRIAQIVANSLTHFDRERYRLFAWCVMPNHVHVVFRILPGFELPDVVQSWKSFTAKQANRLLGTSGSCWQREYYDHLIRNDDELGRAIRYVQENPIKAGLTNWPWVWAQDAPTTAGETPALPARTRA